MWTKAKETKYNKLIQNLSYDDMDADQQLLCQEHDIEYMIPLIDESRKKGITERELASFLNDLYNDYAILDDVAVANAAGISDDDWYTGTEYEDIWRDYHSNGYWDWNNWCKEVFRKVEDKLK